MIEQKKGEKKVYATESSDMVSTFFRYNKLKKDEFILSDGGSAFKVGNVDIFKHGIC